MIKFSFLFFILAVVAKEINCHGMLIDPPNRSSLWRFGFHSTPNYNDNALFCGGRSVQWDINGGKCGICGDDYRLPQPRDNENSGFFGRGIVTQTYNHSSVIQVTVTITANHKGYFTFSLCELTDPDTYEKEECFVDLQLADGQDKYVLPTEDVGNYSVDLQLPAFFTCDRCVLRWEYTAGNSWGICPNFTGALGCGPQETFRTCSDIRII